MFTRKFYARCELKMEENDNQHRVKQKLYR